MNNTTKTYGGISQFIKGIIVSFIITFSCIILFAFLIKWFTLPDTIISPVNLGIKAIAVAIGSFIFTRKGSKGIIKGGLFGIVYTAVAFILFSFLAGSFMLGVGLILDLFFGLIVGAIMGVLGANARK